MFDIGLGRGMSNSEVCSGNEREKHDQAEKSQGEEDVNTECAHEEYEACDSPVHWSVIDWKEEKRKDAYIVTL